MSDAVNPNAVKAGDTEPLVATLSDASGPVNLAGSSVQFRMMSKGGDAPRIHATAQILQGVDGQGRITNRGMVQYNWLPGETDFPGVYGIEWAVTFASGKIRTFPNNRQVTFEIEDAA